MQLSSPVLMSVKLSIDDGNGNTEVLFIGGGFLEVGGNKAVVLAKSAERREDIDVERAERAKQRAEERLAARAEDLMLPVQSLL